MRTRKIIGALSVIFLSACLSLPQAPNAKTVLRIEPPEGASADTRLEFYEIEQHDDIQRSPRTPPEHVQTPERNLIFIALDQEFQSYFDDDLKALYQTDEQVRIEDIAWWIMAPEARKLYDHVIRISYSNFTKETLLAATQSMEGFGKPYDIFLLTHGFPNNIVTADKKNPLTWEDLGQWKGRFPRLELVFMQSCYGSSLGPDWLSTGAKAVLGYKGMDLNFFYPLTLFRAMRRNFTRYGLSLQNLQPQERLERLTKAYEEANLQVQNDVHKSELAQFMVKGLGLTLEEYLSHALNPELFK